MPGTDELIAMAGFIPLFVLFFTAVERADRFRVKVRKNLSLIQFYGGSN